MTCTRRCPALFVGIVNLAAALASLAAIPPGEPWRPAPPESQAYGEFLFEPLIAALEDARVTPTPAPPNEARADPYRDPPPRTRVALRDGHWLINDHPTNPGSVAEGLLIKPPSPAVPAWFPQAPPLPPPGGEVVQVATVDQLLSAVDRVGAGGTILLADGHYRLPRTIVLEGKRAIALRGASGDPTRKASGAIDRGVPRPEATEDISGRPRVGHPDLGAWEFREDL